MTADQKLLLKILRLLKEKTDEGRIPWSESPRRNRQLAVVNGQTYTITLGDEGDKTVAVDGTDESGRQLWSVFADREAPDPIEAPQPVADAAFDLAESVWSHRVSSRVERMRHSLEALTAA